VRFGRVVATTITDKAGQFEFKAVDTGSYLVEMMSASGDVVLASSSILYVGSGEILSTLLKMPLGSPAWGTLLGDSTASALSAVTTAAQAITAAAASSNTPAATPAGEPATSQNPTQR
jgi:pyruvate/2-oxoglutarate dehydrogenase complex dihydrolipoamide acyltransferase (E2) component